MDTSQINLNTLFKQLGLGSTDEDIKAFVGKHAPLSGTTTIADADFWNDSQAEFIRSAINEDAEWAIIVGQLDSLIRESSAQAKSDDDYQAGTEFQCKDCGMKIKLTASCNCEKGKPVFTCCGETLSRV